MELFIAIAILLVGFMITDALKQVAASIIELAETMAEIDGVEFEGGEDESTS